MGEDGQKAKIRPVARVNGEVIRGPGRKREDKSYFNHDIFWLLHVAPGELGKRGSSFESTGGPCHPFDSQSAMFSRLDGARFSVEKERGFRLIWDNLQGATRSKLTARYASRERQDEEIIGLQATFGDLGRLALHLAKDRDDLRKRLSSGGAKRDKVIAALRVQVEAENRAIHFEWLDTERGLALEIPVPRRRA